MDIKALFDMSYGVYFASTLNDGKKVGCIANTAFQITAEPVRLGISINKDNYTENSIRKSGYFVLSIASEYTPMEAIGKFGFYSSRDIDKFADTEYITVGDGLPAVNESCCSWILCKVESEFDCDTHTVFVGEMIDGERISSLPPMTYAYYHKVKGGTTAKNAPTYIEVEDNEPKKQYVCEVCGYVFEGSSEEFESLPDDWTCPVCRVSKDKFKLV